MKGVAITNHVVMKKMMEELRRALEKQDDTYLAREHIRSVRSLCDLMLESESTSTTVADESVEWQKMVGKSNTNKNAPLENQKLEKDVDHGEANGDSIFDF